MFKLESEFPEDSREFESPEDLAKWLESESEGWSWLLNNQVRSRCASDLRDAVSKFINATKVAVETYQNTSEDNNEKQQIFNRIHASIGHMKVFGFSASSVFGCYLRELARFDVELAAGAGWLFRNQPRSASRSESLEVHTAQMAAVLALFKLNLDVKNLTAAEHRSVERTKVDWSATLQVVKSNWQQLVDSGKGELAKLQSMSESQAGDFSEMIKTSQERLESHERFVSEKLILQSPVRHWERQARRCERASYLFGGLFVIALLGGAGLMIWFVNSFALPQALQVTNQNQFWIASLTLLVGGAIAWPVRLLAKLTMSNVHLGTDAKEREVLAKTYLALLRRNKDAELSKEERAVILASLFRSATTGIVKEDGSPTTSIDLLMRFLK